MYHIGKSSRIAITIAATATLVVIGTLSSAMAEEANVEPGSHGAWYRLNDDRDASQQSLEILVSSRRARTKAVEAGMSIVPAGSAQRVDAERGGERELDKLTSVNAAPAWQMPKEVRWINVADTSSRHREVNPTEPLITTEEVVSIGRQMPGQLPLPSAKPDSGQLLAISQARPLATAPLLTSPLATTPLVTQGTNLRLDAGTFHYLQLSDTIHRIEVGNPQICEVLRQADRRLELVAKRNGRTTVTIHFAAARIPEVYAISVGTHDVQQTRLASDQHLQALITEMFPDSDVLLAAEDASLVITGAASNDAEAVQIVSFVRSLRLVPVIDQLKVQR
ncbi:MAG TPA: pilus assembly protein N-terminal domain-containing protein [Pirellulaceae bacterium]|nr:pilus assembly protein N-terminal domain-containing protein [Pirellulaceae bacterium]